MNTVMQKKSKKPVRRLVFKKTVKLVALNFFKHSVGQSAASLAYQLLFALFPLIIFISNLLGVMELDVHRITNVLDSFCPRLMVELIETYFEHISHTSSHVLMWFALVFSIWFPMRAANGLMDDVRRAYGLGKTDKPVLYIVKQLIYTAVFLVVIVLTLFLSTVGEEVLDFVNSILPKDSVQMSEYLVGLWQYLRFVPTGLLMFFSIGLLYSMPFDKAPKIRTVIPGIVFSVVLWLVVSIGFSFYVENFAYFSVIYGTLGAVIVLLIWLYLSAVILILGAELNAAIAKAKEELTEID